MPIDFSRPFIYCPVCESPASDQAPYCPKCGPPLAVPAPQSLINATATDAERTTAETQGAPTTQTRPHSHHTPPQSASLPRSDTELIQEALRRQQHRPQVVVRPAPLVQTIKRTEKKWKALILIGLLTFVGGLGTCTVSMMAGAASQNAAFAGFGHLGFLIALAGLVVAFVGRIGGWWHHG